MQNHRNALELPESRANPSPPIGNVHALGESHALRVDLEPVQVPWFADEVDTLSSAIYEALEGTLDERSEVRGEPSAEADRRRYQLRVLRMIRDQLPLNQRVVRAVVSSPWDEASDLAWEASRVTSPVTVVGPARAMLVLVRGATRNTGDALGEALQGPEARTRSNPISRGQLAHWPELSRLTPVVATRLRDLAEAALAFTVTYVTAVAQHGYSFDPEHYPVIPDELI